MSWTSDNEYSWKMKRNALESQFNSLKDQYTQTIKTDVDNMSKLNEIEAQMTNIREELSRLGIVIKDALEDLRERTGNLEEPILQKEKELQRLQLEENTLRNKKETREEQVSSLMGRGDKTPHTISFLMMKPLSNPYYMMAVVAIFWTFALYLVSGFGQQALRSAGIVVPTPPITGRILMRQNYRDRIG
jgi:hypothetical protein